jgi:hypothetical protein
VKKATPEPWAIDVAQRLIPLGVGRFELADRIKVSRGHVWAVLNGKGFKLVSGANTSPADPPVDGALPDKYAGVTLKELKKLAETRGVDLHGLTKAADIKGALIAADEEDESDNEEGE